jgi:hypothetical protein
MAMGTRMFMIKLRIMKTIIANKAMPKAYNQPGSKLAL